MRPWAASRIDEDELTSLLYDAAQTPLGAVVQTNAPERLRQQLYPLMAKVGLDFTLNIPTKAGELWLVKKN